MADVLTIETPALGDRSYLVHDGTVALVIDPQRDTDRITALAADHGLRITHIAETHIHNDYLTGGPARAAATGAELDRLEGVLWIRPLWLAAWQCWLVCVSPKVSQAFVPDRDYIVALAGRVRDGR